MRFSSEFFAGDDELYKKAKEGADKGGLLPENFIRRKKKMLFEGFSLDEKSCQKAHRYQNKIDLVVGSKKKIEERKTCQSVKQAMSSYSKEHVTPQILRGLADWFCRKFGFIYIEEGALYIYDDGYFRLFTYAYARRFFVQVFREYDVNYALRSSDYKELVHQLQAQPQIMRRQDDCQTNVHVVLFEDGTFDVRTRVMRKSRQEDYQFSKIFFR